MTTDPTNPEPAPCGCQDHQENAMNLSSLPALILWLAVLGGVVMVASRFAGKAAGKASSAL